MKLFNRPVAYTKRYKDKSVEMHAKTIDDLVSMMQACAINLKLHGFSLFSMVDSIRDAIQGVDIEEE